MGCPRAHLVCPSLHPPAARTTGGQQAYAKCDPLAAGVKAAAAKGPALVLGNGPVLNSIGATNRGRSSRIQRRLHAPGAAAAVLAERSAAAALPTRLNALASTVMLVVTTRPDRRLGGQCQG